MPAAAPPGSTEPGQRWVFQGSWCLQDRLPSAAELIARAGLEIGSAAGTKPPLISLDAGAVSAWDSAFALLLNRLSLQLQAQGAQLDLSALPQGLRRLLQLAQLGQPPEVQSQASFGWVHKLGQATLTLWGDLLEFARFVGELLLAGLQTLGGRGGFRARDFWAIVEQVGPQALGIVSLISFLVGLILAYMGAAQLAMFGAQIYIADLVGIGMVREIGALMTGIVIAGRSGAAFAAQLGTMQVNEEIDAYRTTGLAPMQFLVLPRVLALLCMTPLLTVYSSVMGILAGALVAMLVFGLDATAYFRQTLEVLTLTDFWVGLLKGAVYGAMVGLSGCLRGMQCGRSAQAVGEAATSAVVTSILLIVVTASMLTIMFYKLGI
ncbi:phospholipid/cholesterol/gamma-HCH transport system permease protein [Paucibacter oligotrophus]|uniref:Phospholipid/cholesterol/gamma-HCH transport system permease protein n=1 Tax=Roseateles oligotrophus TaxID=1769250 RepID=A0A840LI02_9BURK|nr:ABC transporter permease [Roseateles oligotrophus]MBB4846252.1 phospholipid/cholesterol/gamma-HCH transport system permease protein [Roseateles oligotrophus]